MSDVDWIEKALAEWKYEVVDDIRRDIAIDLRKAYAAHCQASDTDNLAERIADYAVAATHVYGMVGSDPEYLQRLREREEAKKQEMMPHIAEMLAPLLAENERLRAESDARFQMQVQRDEARAESERRLKLLVECKQHPWQLGSEKYHDLLTRVYAETGGAK